MSLAGTDRAASAPDVELRLNVKGWYAVYVWLMGGDIDLEKQFPFDHDSAYSQSAGPALNCPATSASGATSAPCHTTA